MSSALVGQLLVLGSLVCAAFGAAVGLFSGLKRQDAGFKWTWYAVHGFFGFMAAANLWMVAALLRHDFSISYVAQVGSRATPTLYSIVSLWSSLEGSILFWGLILAIYVLAFARVHRGEHARYMSLALGVMLAVGAFFAFLIAGPATPFVEMSPVPLDGPGPNPLLQNHWLMVIHPPMLYLGYVGMTVPFGVAAAALLRGEISPAWMAPLRRWTLVAWSFLTVGIILGAWWAYAVLGWGGYWAWDPVENASLLPWLTATAFIHSTLVQERKEVLRAWTMSLALATFVLTILGTFMTRSGVFNSVHSFTQSDIGPTFLVFLGIILVFSIGLLAARGHLLAPRDRIKSVASREASLLLNNLLFVGITFTVLLGTVFPLLSEALQDRRVSVGEPYFNRMAVPGGLAVLFLMGVGPALPWGRADVGAVVRGLRTPIAAGVLTLVVCLLAGLTGWAPLLTFALAAFVTVLTLKELFLPVRVRMREKGESLTQALSRSASQARRRFGGYVVHLGVVGLLVAVAASSSYVQETSGSLRPGQTIELDGYELTFATLVEGREPHRRWVGARLEVTAPDGSTERLTPRMNFYPMSTDPIGTPAVRSALHEDLYVSLLSFNEGTNTASVNVWTFPLVGWIWWNIPILVGGALFAAWPPRKRSRQAPGGSGVGGSGSGSAGAGPGSRADASREGAKAGDLDSGDSPSQAPPSTAAARSGA